MPNKLPRMPEGLVERIHIKIGMNLPKTAEKAVVAGIMRFHTGRESWPVVMKPEEIPNSEQASKAKANAVAGHYTTLVYDIDVDGNWHFVGVQ